MNKRHLWIATVGPLGRLTSKGQGTLASFVALFFWLPWMNFPIFHSIMLLFLIFIGLAAVDSFLQAYPGDSDPSEVVIDEVVGIGIALWSIPVTFFGVIFAFGIFRLFDIWKPYPISWFDRRGGARGVMFDDLLAGLLTNVLCQVLVYFLSESF